MLKKMKIGLVFLVFFLIIAGCRSGDGRYDYNSDSVTSTVLKSLTGGVRAVQLQYFYENNQLQFAQITTAWVYSKEYIIAPVQLFYVPSQNGRILVFTMPKVLVEVMLLADPTQESNWDREKLGEIINKNDILEGKADIAIIKRLKFGISIDAPKSKYALGNYDELELKHIFYRVTAKKDGSIQVLPVSIIDFRTDKIGRKLINDEGERVFINLGELYFTIRDGKPELVALMCVIDPIEDSPGMVYTYGLDIAQVIEYINNIIKALDR